MALNDHLVVQVGTHRLLRIPEVAAVIRPYRIGNRIGLVFELHARFAFRIIGSLGVAFARGGGLRIAGGKPQRENRKDDK